MSQWDQFTSADRLFAWLHLHSPNLYGEWNPIGNSDFKTNVLQFNVGYLALRADQSLFYVTVLCHVNPFTCKKRKQRFMPPHRYPCCLCEAYCTFMFVCQWFMKDEVMWFKGIRLSEQLLSFCLLESCGNLDRIVHADIVGGGGGGACVCVWCPLWKTDKTLLESIQKIKYEITNIQSFSSNLIESSKRPVLQLEWGHFREYIHYLVKQKKCILSSSLVAFSLY